MDSLAVVLVGRPRPSVCCGDKDLILAAFLSEDIGHWRLIWRDLTGVKGGSPPAVVEFLYKKLFPLFILRWSPSACARALAIDDPFARGRGWSYLEPRRSWRKEAFGVCPDSLVRCRTATLSGLPRSRTPPHFSGFQRRTCVIPHNLAPMRSSESTLKIAASVTRGS